MEYFLTGAITALICFWTGVFMGKYLNDRS